MTFDQRWTEITDIWKNILPKFEPDEWRAVERGLAIFGALSVVGLLLFGGDAPLFGENNENTLAYFTNVFTEGLGVVFTIVILNQLARRRETKTKQAELLNQVRSRSNDIAIGALEQLRHEGWLTGEDGLLARKGLYNVKWEGADLGGANLSAADLEQANLSAADLGLANLSDANLMLANLSAAHLVVANLSGADLLGANLSVADLEQANLSDAHLLVANLSEADLRGANLSGADLRQANLSATDLAYANLSAADLGGANLSDADLVGANLSGASLVGANLSAARLENAAFDEQTRLPDGETWTPETDMTRYTDPAHPDFWQPAWAAAGYDSRDAWFEAGRPAPEPGDDTGSAD